MGEFISVATATDVSTCRTIKKDFLSTKAAIKINFGCTCDNPAFWEYVDHLLEQIEAISGRKRKRKRRSKGISPS